MKALMVWAVSIGLLCASLTSYSQDPPDPFKKTSKRALWDAGQRYRQKWHDCGDDIAVEERRLEGCRRKLATRTSTAIRKLVVPPAVPSSEGWSTEMVLLSGLVGLAIGAFLGVILTKRSDPAVVVTK